MYGTEIFVGILRSLQRNKLFEFSTFCHDGKRNCNLGISYYSGADRSLVPTLTQEGVRPCDQTTKAWDRKKTLITFQDNLHCIFHYFNMQIVLTNHRDCSTQPNVVWQELLESQDYSWYKQLLEHSQNPVSQTHTMIYWQILVRVMSQILLPNMSQR